MATAEFSKFAGMLSAALLQHHLLGLPLQCSCLENSRDRGAWWAAIYGVAQSRTLTHGPCETRLFHQSFLHVRVVWLLGVVLGRAESMQSV